MPVGIKCQFDVLVTHDTLDGLGMYTSQCKPNATGVSKRVKIQTGSVAVTYAEKLWMHPQNCLLVGSLAEVDSNINLVPCDLSVGTCFL